MVALGHSCLSSNQPVPHGASIRENEGRWEGSQLDVRL